jgi:hypothetical protein
MCDRELERYLVNVLAATLPPGLNCARTAGGVVLLLPAQVGGITRTSTRTGGSRFRALVTQL